MDVWEARNVFAALGIPEDELDALLANQERARAALEHDAPTVVIPRRGLQQVITVPPPPERP